MKNPDVIVIGAGPAGATASAYLNKCGHQVLVLEKEHFPRFVIGESLLPGAMNFLEEAGLLQSIEKNEFQIKTGATFHKDDKKCNFLFSEQYTDGWSWTWQVQREQFDQKLISEAEKQGVKVFFDAEVLDVTTSKEKQSVLFKNKDGSVQTVNCKFIVDASGYGRVLPRLFDLNCPSSQDIRGSVFTHMDDSKRNGKESNNIFVHSFDHNKAWFWIIPFLNKTASVGIVTSNDKIEEYSKNGNKKFMEFIRTNPVLKQRFSDIEPLFTPKTILGFSIGVKQMHGEGYVLCGNSTEFLDPVFSSGVTLAIGSGLMSAKLVNRHLSGEVVDWKMEYDSVLKKGIEVFRSYVNAWYDGTLETIFYAESIDQKIKNQICSVLAGYVWDNTNPFVKKHKTVLTTLAKVISMQASA